MKTDFFLCVIAVLLVPTLLAESSNKILEEQKESSLLTAADYCSFLNSVAAADPYALYDQGLEARGWRLEEQNENQANTGLMIRSGEPGHYTYAVPFGEEERPMTYVDLASVRTYCQWKENDCIATEISALIFSVDNEASPDSFLKSNKSRWNLTVVMDPLGLGLANNALSGKQKNQSCWRRFLGAVTGIAVLFSRDAQVSNMEEERPSQEVRESGSSPLLRSSAGEGDVPSSSGSTFYRTPDVTASMHEVPRALDEGELLFQDIRTTGIYSFPVLEDLRRRMNSNRQATFGVFPSAYRLDQRYQSCYPLKAIKSDALREIKKSLEYYNTVKSSYEDYLNNPSKETGTPFNRSVATAMSDCHRTEISARIWLHKAEQAYFSATNKNDRGDLFREAEKAAATVDGATEMLDQIHRIYSPVARKAMGYSRAFMEGVPYDRNPK